jgi:hypothetical protein
MEIGIWFLGSSNDTGKKRRDEKHGSIFVAGWRTRRETDRPLF